MGTPNESVLMLVGTSDEEGVSNAKSCAAATEQYEPQVLFGGEMVLMKMCESDGDVLGEQPGIILVEKEVNVAYGKLVGKAVILKLCFADPDDMGGPIYIGPEKGVPKKGGPKNKKRRLRSGRKTK